ncbi:hypothetical protein I3843_14G081100 [Carya illinoinensis]|nr:hypothetical protein I3843_14G081100 [Carya illinoinensis]
MTITKRGRGRPRGGRSCAQGRSSCETQVRNTVPISTLNPRDEMGGGSDDSTEPPAMTEFPNAGDNSPRNRNDIDWTKKKSSLNSNEDIPEEIHCNTI